MFLLAIEIKNTDITHFQNRGTRFDYANTSINSYYFRWSVCHEVRMMLIIHSEVFCDNSIGHSNENFDRRRHRTFSKEEFGALWGGVLVAHCVKSVHAKNR